MWIPGEGGGKGGERGGIETRNPQTFFLRFFFLTHLGESISVLENGVWGGGCGRGGGMRRGDMGMVRKDGGGGMGRMDKGGGEEGWKGGWMATRTREIEWRACLTAMGKGREGG